MYKSEYLIRCRSRCTDFASLPPRAWRNCCATWWALATHHSHHCDAMAVGLFRSTMISQQIVNIANKSLRHYNNSNNKKNNNNNQCMCLFVSHSRHQQHDRQHQMWQRHRQQQQPAAATQSQRWLQHTNSICCIIVGGGCNVAQDLSHCFTVRLSVRLAVCAVLLFPLQFFTHTFLCNIFSLLLLLLNCIKTNCPHRHHQHQHQHQRRLHSSTPSAICSYLSALMLLLLAGWFVACGAVTLSGV